MEATAVEEPRIGRSAAIGALVGFVIVGLLYGGVVLAGGADRPGALGVAVFAGIWGGPGFGAMLGATIAATPPKDRRRGTAIG